jgi:hypothetical protein
MEPDMVKTLLRATLIALALPALADEPNSPSREPEVANDIRCYPIADIKNAIAGAGGRLIQLTPEQFQFARGLFVAAPPVSTALPPGDHALLGEIGDRTGLLFIDGDNACDAGPLPTPLRRMLLDVGAGKINHVGGGA